MTDIQIIRDALTLGKTLWVSGKEFDDALAALSRLEERVIPELPEGWFIGLIVKNSFGWCVKLINDIGTWEHTSNGATINKAIQNAINKIGGGGK